MQREVALAYYMKRWNLFWVLCLLLITSVRAQQVQEVQETPFLHNFLATSDTFRQDRLNMVLGAEAAVYSAAVYALYQYWYKDYPSDPFHFFNDNREWLQQDKAGHVFTAYFEANLTTGLYKWTGMEPRKAYWAGFATASIFQLTIEMFDAYSEKWGFSMGDFAANTLGAGLSLGQNLLWEEQRIQIKFSQHFPDYANYDPIVRQRAQSLYGTAAPEQLVKDYNGLTTWISVNPYKFMRQDTWWPKWLMVSGGYGANGLLGGFENYWCTDPLIRPEDCLAENRIDYTNVPRYRQYYLSLDLDLQSIETDSPFWNMMFELLSIIKVPMPTIEFNGDGRVNFYSIYF